MKYPIRSLLLTLALIAGSGAGGAWIGARLLQPAKQDHQDFHDRLFADLHLSDEQRVSMDALEERHAAEIALYQDRLAAANRILADIVTQEDSYNGAVDDAVVNVHSAMLDLQKMTIRHLFEMREILNPEQQVIFDRHVAATFQQFTK
jgi:hypothetical protein